jgi:hypothetical protein
VLEVLGQEHGDAGRLHGRLEHGVPEGESVAQDRRHGPIEAFRPGRDHRKEGLPGSFSKTSA